MEVDVIPRLDECNDSRCQSIYLRILPPEVPEYHASAPLPHAVPELYRDHLNDGRANARSRLFAYAHAMLGHVQLRGVSVPCMQTFSFVVSYFVGLMKHQLDRPFGHTFGRDNGAIGLISHAKPRAVVLLDM